MTNLKLYNDLATWWPLLSPPEDYAEEAQFFWEMLSKMGLPAAPTLLELGCGGGSNAFHLKAHFAQITLTDLSPAMLAMSQAINPECEHQPGDMRTVRLGRLFDAVFIHDAIEYMLTLADLQQALTTAYVHCKPGGCALFVPDNVRETFEPNTDHGGSDGDGRSLRYIEWSHDPDENDTVYNVEYVYLLREGNNPVQVEHDPHVLGLFPRAEWLRCLQAVGFAQVECIRDPDERELFLARKPQ